MPMEYEHQFISPADVPRARVALLQHTLDTYASETSKTAGVWSELTDAQLEFRPHARSSTVRQILAHQILSERRFFAEFVGLAEPPVETLLPPGDAPERRRLRGAPRGAGPRAAGSIGGGRRGVLAGRGPVFRRAAPAHLGVLAPRAAYRPSPGAGRRLSPAARGSGAPDLRSHRRRDLARRRSDRDPGRGAPARDIIQQQAAFSPRSRERLRHG